MTVLLVTGTGTGVGKTVVTAAVAALAVARGDRVTVLKPAQTGEPDGAPGDADVAARLAPGVRTVELVRYPDPLSPEAAARRSGRPPLTLARCVSAIEEASADADLVLVEGAGGLLVRYDRGGLTIADIAREAGLPVVLVTTARLGTLNTTALTLEAMAARGLELHGLVIGAWPSEPDLAARSNVDDLEALAASPLAGAVPEGAPARPNFVDAARHALAPSYGGTFDSTSLRGTR